MCGSNFIISLDRNSIFELRAYTLNSLRQKAAPHVYFKCFPRQWQDLSTIELEPVFRQVPY